MAALVDLATAITKALGADPRSPAAQGILAGTLQEVRDRLGGRTFYVGKGEAPEAEVQEVASIVTTRLRFAGHDLAQAHAIAAAVVRELRDAWRGAVVYLPAGRLAKAARKANLVRAEWEAGTRDPRVLAQRHGITVRHVHRLLSARKPK